MLLFGFGRSTQGFLKYVKSLGHWDTSSASSRREVVAQLELVLATAEPLVKSLTIQGILWVAQSKKRL
jgi:hypothetical protein